MKEIFGECMEPRARAVVHDPSVDERMRREQDGGSLGIRKGERQSERTEHERTKSRERENESQSKRFRE